jgi:acylglycerol lipase
MHDEATLTTGDGTLLFRQWWSPDTAPRGTVMISHGLAEHSGRYANVVDRLVPAGYVVHAHDHRGHGRSGGERCYVDHIDRFVEDLELVRTVVRQQHPTGPLILLGHSMGGGIALAYAVRYQRHLDALALSGPASDGGKNLNVVQRLLIRTLARVAPHHKMPALPSEAICRDPAVVAAYDNDPLVFRGVTTARLLGELRRNAALLATQSPSITLPVLLQHGEADELVSVEATRRLVRTLGSSSVTVHTYPGLAHEVFNEPEKAAVLTDLVTWLDQVTVQPT